MWLIQFTGVKISWHRLLFLKGNLPLRTIQPIDSHNLKNSCPFLKDKFKLYNTDNIVFHFIQAIKFPLYTCRFTGLIAPVQKEKG
jgi:hypothetical protein